MRVSVLWLVTLILLSSIHNWSTGREDKKNIIKQNKNSSHQLCLSSGCYNKNITDSVAYKQQTFISLFWKVLKSRLICRQFWRLEVQGRGARMGGFWGEASSGYRLLTSPCILTWRRAERGRKLSWDSFKSANPIHKGFTFMNSSNSN